MSSSKTCMERKTPTDHKPTSNKEELTNWENILVTKNKN